MTSVQEQDADGQLEIEILFLPISHSPIAEAEFQCGKWTADGEKRAKMASHLHR